MFTVCLRLLSFWSSITLFLSGGRLMLLANPLEQLTCRLIARLLRDQFPLKGTLEDGLTKTGRTCYVGPKFLFRLVRGASCRIAA